jgi:hypothetical protein
MWMRHSGMTAIFRLCPRVLLIEVAALIAWLPIVRVDGLVKDRRPPKAAALRAVLDKSINTNRNAVQAIKAAF